MFHIEKIQEKKDSKNYKKSYNLVLDNTEVDVLVRMENVIQDSEINRIKENFKVLVKVLNYEGILGINSRSHKEIGLVCIYVVLEIHKVDVVFHVVVIILENIKVVD